jgi:hypothetical protein
MANALTGQVGVTLVPIVLDTLVKHYFNHLRKEASSGKNTTQLRQDELLYDQAFRIVKVSDCEMILVTLPLSVAFMPEFSRSCFTVSNPPYLTDFA